MRSDRVDQVKMVVDQVKRGAGGFGDRAARTTVTHVERTEEA